MKTFGTRALLRIAALAAAGTALSGCVYDVGLGYASDGYYDDYGCDPYGGYDSYYDCDYGSGFSNIGFGGGWYDNYYYPGYGYYLFDNGGRRHAMRDNHRRYWSEKRHSWYREHRGRDRDRNDYRGRGRNYSDGVTPGAIGWPERNGGRVRDGDDNRRGRGDGQGRRNRSDQWRGGDGNGANAVPTPNPDDARGRGNGQRGDGQGRGRWRGGDNPNGAAQPNSSERRGDDGQRNSGQRNWRQPAPQPSSGQIDAPAARPAPQPRGESPQHEAPHDRVGRRGAERPD